MPDYMRVYAEVDGIHAEMVLARCRGNHLEIMNDLPQLLGIMGSQCGAEIQKQWRLQSDKPV